MPRARHFHEATKQAEGTERLWGKLSTWGLLLPLLYFALDGVSPFVNGASALRAVATSSAGGVLVDRLNNVLIFGGCMLFAVRHHGVTFRLAREVKLVVLFPVLALLLFPVSQQPTRTLSSGVVLLGGVLLMIYVQARYRLDDILEILLLLGGSTMLASVVFALALPQYGLDLMGGHSTAWKGIFSAKNYLGNMALFFLTGAVCYRPRTQWLGRIRLLQIFLCLVCVAFSRAATAYLLTAVYLAYAASLHLLRGLRKKDYFVACILFFVAFGLVIALIVARPDFLFALLEKDVTLTGRTEIWDAVLDSIAKRPLLGYGYQAFWLGFQGESYRIILAVTWALGQAQNGFLDVLLEMGLAGLVPVLLILFFAFRDAILCLLRSHDRAQLRHVEWYLAIVLLTVIYNLDESFLFEPRHLGSLLMVLACVGLKIEWLRLKAHSLNARSRAGTRFPATRIAA